MMHMHGIDEIRAPHNGLPTARVATMATMQPWQQQRES